MRTLRLAVEKPFPGRGDEIVTEAGNAFAELNAGFVYKRLRPALCPTASTTGSVL